MKALRAAAADRAARDAAICTNLLSLPQFCGARNILLYRPVGTEASPLAAAEELQRRGKNIFYPRVLGKEMLPVRDRGLGFAAGAFGIQEPIGEAEDLSPDIVVLPMLAADRQLYRLGYGGGYYDRYLARRPQALRIGICYSFQLADRLPAEPHDLPLHILVTDGEILFSPSYQWRDHESTQSSRLGDR